LAVVSVLKAMNISVTGSWCPVTGNRTILFKTVP